MPLIPGGNILHSVVGNEDKIVVGGHLIKGIVEVTNKTVLLKTRLKLKRRLDGSTRLQGMYPEGG